MHEPQAVAERYARRGGDADRYSPLRPEVQRWLHERQRAMRRFFVRAGWTDATRLDALEVGCGSGGNLLELLQLGFTPARLQGIELLPERAARARERLPAALRVHEGDACEVPIAHESQDLVWQSTVFSSLLDDAFQQRLAHAMWRWVKPGGAVLWYDFTVNNPRNPDVRGVPRARLAELFPEARIDAVRATLAPPLARAVCRVHPALHDTLNLLPFLRTHVLAWIAKPTPTQP